MTGGVIVSKEAWFQHYERRVNEFEAENGRHATPEEERWLVERATDDLIDELAGRVDRTRQRVDRLFLAIEEQRRATTANDMSEKSPPQKRVL